MVRLGSMVALASMLSVAPALEVKTPSEGLIVIADRTYTVEWDGNSDNHRYEIDLYYCGSYCTEDECGEWVTALCPYGDDGCPDNDGDYDIVMPEPMNGKSGPGYRVRVVDIEDEENGDCSDDFYLLHSNEASEVGDEDGPTLSVTSPGDGDVATACKEYTVQFDYDNGYGSAVERFAIDLYKADGTSDCGTYVTSVCDKETIGCKDSAGDYDVEIPCDTSSGEYKIRVATFQDDSLYACSDTFTVEGGGGGDDDNMSYNF
ncbi:unnamed protein product [Pylaiella littoralis]